MMRMTASSSSATAMRGAAMHAANASPMTPVAILLMDNLPINIGAEERIDLRIDELNCCNLAYQAGSRPELEPCYGSMAEALTIDANSLYRQNEKVPPWRSTSASSGRNSVVRPCS